ncbi:hypothetical protein F5887DRAFT_193365 [Amanita rubescens]|nr:hypothetical protein F5887DRAFT_193365 [Amanita rubescens]
MYPSLRIFTSRAHQPLIKFLGKRSWPSARDIPRAHPAAPSGLRPQSASSLPSKSFITPSHVVFNPYWEAPRRLWHPKVRNLDAPEMDAIMSGGASMWHS